LYLRCGRPRRLCLAWTWAGAGRQPDMLRMDDNVLARKLHLHLHVGRQTLERSWRRHGRGTISGHVQLHVHVHKHVALALAERPGRPPLPGTGLLIGLRIDTKAKVQFSHVARPPWRCNWRYIVACRCQGALRAGVG
ncbi:hypothetical protein Vretifemale_547, partial [Volvox reticuliferus]